jgi:hypothetical protein
VTIESDEVLEIDTRGRRELGQGLISGLWISAWFAEALYYVAALVLDGLIPVILFIFGQIALASAILGTVVYVWTMPRWNRDVMGWMWAGCLIGGLWLGMYYVPLAPLVWGLALVTTLKWLPAWRPRRQSGMPPAS